MTELDESCFDYRKLCHSETSPQTGRGNPSPKTKGEIIMDFYKVPIGFGMALAVNEPAMNAYSKMSEQQSRTFWQKPTTSAPKWRCTPSWQTLLMVSWDDMQKAPTWVLFMHLIFLSLPKRAGIRKTVNRPYKKKNNPDIRSRYRSLRACFLPESNSAHRSTAFA